jgi:metal-dependent amidase/aminoacylase/carboxypeptidase family protein/mannose-6-phosphate isomerase-like protein (cupin superfamily)
MFTSLIALAIALGQQAAPPHVMIQPEAIVWRGAAGGLQTAIAEGNPQASGQFTMMLRLPDGVWIPPHFHNVEKRLVVITGELLMGHGDTLDATRTTPLKAGGIAVMPPNTNHYEGGKGETIVALIANGPFTTTMVARPAAQGGAQMADRIDQHLRAREPDLIALRRDLHQHPEVSGREERTARVIAGRLRALGLDVRTGVGGHGVVGILTGGRPGPLVAYRADMDAVASSTPDSVPFASLTPGVRHICGHDIHVTVGVALAEALSHVRADLPGSVMFIFQPAEERATGARAMLDAGLFATDRPVAIYGVHLAPLEVGQLAVKPGVMMLPNAAAPGAINDEVLTRAAKAAIARRLGAASVVDLSAPPQGFSEDFGWFQKQVPGVFFFLGASNSAQGVVAMPHTPTFVADEGAIVGGARAMAAVVLERMTAKN